MKYRDDPHEPKFIDQSGQLVGRWVTDRAISSEAGLLPFISVDRIGSSAGSSRGRVVAGRIAMEIIITQSSMSNALLRSIRG